jgi:hypothetical protein
LKGVDRPMKQIHIRIDEKLLAKIDKARGDIPRVRYLVRLIEKGVK